MKLTPIQREERMMQFLILEDAGLIKRHPRPDGSAGISWPAGSYPALLAFTNAPCSQDDFLAALGPELIERSRNAAQARLAKLQSTTETTQ